MPSCGEPGITIESPVDGVSVAAGAVSLDFAVQGVFLMPPPSPARRPVLPGRALFALVPEAHAYECPLGFVAVRLGGREVGRTDLSPYTLQDVPPGEHTVEVVLHFQGGDEVVDADTVAFTAR